MQTKLYRSSTNRVICGVCGGLGAYLQIDPVIIRIIFVLMALGHGAGVLIYLLMCLVIPSDDTIPVGSPAASLGVAPTQAGLVAGILLMLVGAVFLGQNLNIVALRWLNGDVLWPLLLIGGGILLLRRRMGEDRSTPGKGAS